MEIIKAINSHNGRVTAGQIAGDVSTGLAEAEIRLRELAALYSCNLLVTGEGEIIYDFGKDIKLRVTFFDSAKDILKRCFHFAWRAFVYVFKLWIVLMMVVYFMFYICCLLALFLASKSRNSANLNPVFRMFGEILKHAFKGAAQSGSNFEDNFIVSGKYPWEFAVSPEKYQEVYKNLPFYEKVFHFVFGRIHGAVSLREKEKTALDYIRNQKGVITASEICAIYGCDLASAEKETARLFAKYEGDADVTDDGVIIYRFPSLMKNLENPQNNCLRSTFMFRAILDASERKCHSDVFIPALNGFNLLVSLLMYFFLMDFMEIPRDPYEFWISWFPMIFSVMFFFIPLLRFFSGVLLKSGFKFNILKNSFLRMIFLSKNSLEMENILQTLNSFSPVTFDEKYVSGKIDNLILDYKGDVAAHDSMEDGRSYLVFTRMHNEIRAVLKIRKSIKIEDYRTGKVEYSTEDEI
jgi:hypothetical protein